VLERVLTMRVIVVVLTDTMAFSYDVHVVEAQYVVQRMIARLSVCYFFDTSLAFELLWLRLST